MGTNITGVNAFFVRADLAEGKFALPATAENLYNPPQYQTRHITRHPSEFCLLGKGEIFPNGDGTTGIEDRTAFALDAVHIDAQTDADTLFEMLEGVAMESSYIVVENGMRNYEKAQVILCFLDRYRMFLEHVYAGKVSDRNTCNVEMYPGGGHNCQDRIYIKLDREIGNPDKCGYSELANTYTESYYMTDCGGYDDFRNSHGMEMTPRLREVYSLAAPSQGDRILDIGCGRGELSFALAAAGAQVVGIDYSKDAIAIAKRTFGEKYKTLHYTCADIFEMDNLGIFDKIIMADVVEHIEQEVLEKIFQKISLSLSKEGCLIIHTAPNRDYYDITYPELRQQAKRLGVWKPRNPRSYYEQLMHINEQTPTGLKSALEKFFRYVRVWTGGVRGIDEVKTQDEGRLDMDIFAIACQESSSLEARIDSFTRRPEWDGCRVSIEAADIEIPAGKQENVIDITLLNEGTESLCALRKYPINLTYHILDRDGNMLLFDGERTPIWEEIGPGAKKTMQMRLTLPGELACCESCVCRVTLVAEGCFWFDQEGGNKKDVVIHFNESKEER